MRAEIGVSRGCLVGVYPGELGEWVALSDFDPRLWSTAEFDAGLSHRQVLATRVGGGDLRMVTLEARGHGLALGCSG